jgi:uncharacterized protein
MQRISLLVKPVSGLCNLECSYCFYKEELGRMTGLKPGIMSEKVRSTLIERVIQEAERTIEITFQGGEPTLAGLQFYEDFVAEIESKKKPGQRVFYAIQTNGIVLEEKWADFLAAHDFLVGLSFDGMPFVHDLYRKDSQGRGSAEKVEKAFRLLQQKKVRTNLVCVVTRQAAKKPERLFRYMKALGGTYLQFIPCIEPEDCGEQNFALSGREYAEFLKGLFDLWYQGWLNGDYVSIRQFEDYVHLGCGREPSCCAASGSCGSYLVVEQDGSLYPCDFYVQDAWYLGNLLTMSLEEALHTQKALDFLTQTPEKKACADCAYAGVCRGGCKRDYQLLQGQEKNRFCQAYQEFFAYSAPRLLKIVEEERRQCPRINKALI